MIQTLKPRARSCSRPSSVILSGPHGGSHLLVSCDRFGRLDHGRFTPLPGAAPQTAVAAAW